MLTTQSTEPNCPFCAIVEGRGAAREVLRTDGAVAFLPDVPAVLGHTMVVPTAHVEDIWSLDHATAQALTHMTLRVARAVRDATLAEGMNLVQSNGAAAGQSVFHLHVHVVPRREGDRMLDLWPPDTDWDASVVDKSAQTIRDALMKRD